MYQKKNSAAWRIIALLSVLSLGISLLAMSSTLIYAASKDSINLNIWRPDTSRVGAVKVNGTCQPIVQQHTLVAVQSFDNPQQNLTIENFPDAQCSAQGFPNSANTFQDRLDHLPPCTTNSKCRVYMTPSQA
jgi:hypothetical protein